MPMFKLNVHTRRELLNVKFVPAYAQGNSDWYAAPENKSTDEKYSVYAIDPLRLE